MCLQKYAIGQPNRELGMRRVSRDLSASVERDTGDDAGNANKPWVLL
jgi:hypothetical protein